MALTQFPVTLSIGGGHAVVNLDKMHATYHGNLESVVAGVNLDNGSFVNLGTLIDREQVNAVQPATATLGTAEVLLVASPEVTYYAGQTVADFFNVSGKPARAYHMVAGDEFTITSAALDGGAAVAVGSYVVAQNGSYKPLAQVAAPAAGANRFVGQIVESNTLTPSRTPSVTIKVLQA